MLWGRVWKSWEWDSSPNTPCDYYYQKKKKKVAAEHLILYFRAHQPIPLPTGKKIPPSLVSNFFFFFFNNNTACLPSCAFLLLFPSSPFENESKDRSLAFLHEHLSEHLQEREREKRKSKTQNKMREHF